MDEQFQIQIIDDEKKIINIFKLLQKTAPVLNLRNLLVEYRGKITELLPEQLIFHSDVNIINLQNHLRISFYYLNKYHYFDTELVKADKNNKKLALAIPRQIYIHTKRQYKRYKVDDHYLTCNLKVIGYDKDIQTHHKIQGLSGTMKSIYSELSHDKPDFPRIVKLIYKENKNICDDFKIYTLIDKLPDNNIASFLENFKKPLLLNNLFELKYNQDSKPGNNANYLILTDYIDFLSRINVKNVQNVILELANYYKKNSIFSLLYVPIVILGRVIGTLKVANKTSSKRLFRANDVNYFISIAKIINESIIKNKLNSIDDSYLNIKIEDISLSGIGITV